ncbi:hypothetical protein CRG98_014243 [Punica granatum]|uniref:Uncharacterized protein n=1 Tax=Punica granatum TaxID=22663 RepID=A0A2I0K9Z7_PUNGR|nr:hypothetical protein CRG98_014243 [Punica granatum]
MTTVAVPSIKEGCFMVRGKAVLHGVPQNVSVKPVTLQSVFIGAKSTSPSSHHIFTLGHLEISKFLFLFRAKIWWMIPRVGESANQIPVETQMLLQGARRDSAVDDGMSPDGNPESRFYILMLPVLDGDTNVQTTEALESVLVNSGDNLFEVIKDSIKCVIALALLGGCSPRFLIIDDGWQDTFNEFQKEGEPFIQGTQQYEFIDIIKGKYGLKFMYMWHALLGYWGGLHLASNNLKKYNPRLVFPIQSDGNTANLRDIAMDCIEKYGTRIIGIERVHDFYDDLHGYLVSCGVDGVKGALEQSVARNFKDNSVIFCMSHSYDSIFNSKKSAVARASEDFMPRESTFQTLHVTSVAFNGLLLGEVMVPDWDMFQTVHDKAEFHAAARAAGSCPVYISNKPWNHDFKILEKLVLPDGSVLRAKYAGRPT